MLWYKMKHLLSESAITFPLYLAIRSLKNSTTRLMPDRLYAQWKYLKKTGMKLNLDNPQTFDEKVWWLKFNDRSELKHQCSDKLEVRKYVEKCGLGKILTQVGETTYKNYKDVKFEELPDRCILKCNHTSGCNMFYFRGKEFDYNRFRREFGYWMTRDYYQQGREYNYRGIDRKIFWEEYLDAEDELGLIDWRFMCFGGEVKFVMVDINTTDDAGGHSAGAKRNIYSPDFAYQNVRFTRDNFNPKLICKPENWERMIEIAQILSKPFIHCRVDLYNIKGKIYFGEITFHHAGGCNIIAPENMQLEYGKFIKLPQKGS